MKVIAIFFRFCYRRTTFREKYMAIIQEYSVAEFPSTLIRLSEIRVRIDLVDRNTSITRAMAISDCELSTLRQVRSARRYMENCSDREHSLAVSNYQRAEKAADDITHMIATKIAHSLRHAISDGAPNENSTNDRTTQTQPRTWL